MAKLRITTGDIVEISHANQNKEAKPYITVVDNYDGKITVLVNTPITQGSYVRLPLNETYLVKFISKKGVYEIYASINKYTSEGNIQFTELKLTGKGKRIQQRNYYRLPCSNIVNFHIRIED